MKKLSVFAALLALFVGTAARLQSEPRVPPPGADSAMLNSRAAFRDGLYLGRFTGRRGGQIHIANGRWATAADRGLFTAGFQQGYQEIQTSRAAVARVDQER
jgi:hypothetical protein